MRTPPGSALSHQSVEDDQQLPHTRNQRHLLGLSGLNESLVEFLDGGIEARSDQGSHVERFSNPRPAAPHRATASQSARVAIERSDANESRELPRRKRAELGQFGKERPAKHGTHPGDAPQESFVLFEGGTVLDGLIEVTIRAGKLLLKPSYVGFDAPADSFGGARPEAIFLGGHHLDDLPSPGEGRPRRGPLPRRPKPRQRGARSHRWPPRSPERQRPPRACREAPRFPPRR